LDLGLGMHIIMYGFRLLPVGVSLKITRITPPRPLHTVVLSRQSEGNHRGYLLRPIHAPDLLALCNPLPKVVQPPPKQGCPHGGFVVAAMLVVGAEVGGITTPTAKGPLTNSSVRIRPRISGSRCSLIWGPIKKPARVHCILEVSYAPRLGCHIQGWLLLAYPLRGRIRGRLSRCAGHDSVAILVQGLSSLWALLPSALEQVADVGLPRLGARLQLRR
jgi:hypothetical protein